MDRNPRQGGAGSRPQPADHEPGVGTSSSRNRPQQGGGDRDPGVEHTHRGHDRERDGGGGHGHGSSRRSGSDRFPTNPPPCDDPYYCDDDHIALYHDLLRTHHRNGIRGPSQLHALFRGELGGVDDSSMQSLLDNGPLMVHYGWITEAFLVQMGGSMLSDDEEESDDGGLGGDSSGDESEGGYTASSGYYGRRGRDHGGRGLGYGSREGFFW